LLIIDEVGKLKAETRCANTGYLVQLSQFSNYILIVHRKQGRSRFTVITGF